MKYLGDRDNSRRAGEDAVGRIDAEHCADSQLFVLPWFRMTRVCQLAAEESLARLVAKDRDADIVPACSELEANGRIYKVEN